jgi:hypothetical protein
MARARKANLFWAITLLAASPAAASEPAPLPAGKAEAPPVPMMVCPGLGKGFFLVPGTSTCLRIGLDVLVESRSDLVSNDLSVETRRIASPIPGAAADPVALYGTIDETRIADRYAQRNDSRLIITAVTTVDGAPVASYLSLRNGYAFTASDLRARNPGTTAVGVDQAWISAFGVTAGLRTSVFDFSSGLTYSGGYASSRVVNQIAYEKSFGPASLAVSAEDGRSRRYEDGVWASYGGQTVPDLVLRGRITPDWGVVHLAGALHTIHDAPTGRSSVAFAVNAGVEVRQDWGKLFNKDGGPFGRFQLTAAYADGALDYLGVPRFSTDYVLDADGSLSKTRGVSAGLSYEHIVRPDLKLTAGVSAYRTKTSLINFDWTTRGALAQLGIEYNPFAGTYLGAEVNYFWDQSRGVYYAIPGDRPTVDFVNAMVYLRRTL